MFVILLFKETHRIGVAKNTLGIRQTTPHTYGKGGGAEGGKGWGGGRGEGGGGMVKDKTADYVAVSQA